MISRGGSTQHERNMETPRPPKQHYAEIRFTGAGGVKADTMGRIKTRLRMVEHRLRELPLVERSRKAESAREIAMKEARERGLLRRHRAEAKAMGRFNPLSWARKETANVVYQRMKDLGVAHPPAIETIMKWKF